MKKKKVKMKKRGIFSAFSIILLLILMPGVYSIYEESVYSGTVEDKDLIEVSGKAFKFRIDSVSNKVIADIIDDVAVIISGGECKIAGNFDICISNISFSYRNEDYTDVYKALVNIYQIKAKLDIKNTIEKNNILIDEETTAELTIENTAGITAEGVVASIKIPSSVLVTDTEGCKKTSDSIVFLGDVHSTQIRKCTYKIKGLAGNDFNLTADVSYFDGIERIDTTSETINGKVYNYSLKISSELNKSKFDIYEKFDVTINIENINDQYDLRITNFKIKMPEKLLIIKKPKEAAKNKGIVSWSGTLAPNENKEFLLELQGIRAANYTVVTEASYKISTFFRSAKKESDIEIDCDCPSIQHVFLQQIAVPDQRVRLNAYIKNPSSDNDFSNLKIDYHTNIPNVQDYSKAYGQIRPLETITIFDSSIITPPLDEIYHFNITATYESASNQVFIAKDNIIIEIPKVEETKVEEVIDEETRIGEEQEIEEEKQEESEEVLLGTEETGEIADESEKRETSEEEILVTTLEDEKESPIKAFTIIAYIAALIFILIILVIFKRKKAKKPEKVKNAPGNELRSNIQGEKMQMIKESLLGIFRKKENKSMKTDSRKTDHSGNEDMEYRELEKQIRSLGITPEDQTKTGFFEKIFRKK